MALNSQQQSQLTSALQSKGYSQTDAANAAANAGGRAMELYREYIGGGSSGGGGGNQGVDQAVQQLRSAISTSTDALKGQQSLLPQQTTQRKTELQNQQSNLETRYADLISEVKGQGQQALARTESTGKEELARRGINLQGNLGQTEINSMLNPLNEEMARQIKQVGTSREGDLMTLTNMLNRLPLEEQQQMLKIQEAMGRVQMAGSQTELDLALKMLANEQANLNAQREYDLALADQEMKREYNAAQIANIESQIFNRGADGGGGLGGDQEAILNSYWSNSNASLIPDYFKPVTTANTYTTLQTEPIKHADFRNMSVNPNYTQNLLPKPVPTPGMSR